MVFILFLSVSFTQHDHFEIHPCPRVCNHLFLLLLSSIPLFHNVSIYQLMGIWIVFTFGLLDVKMLWTPVYKNFFEIYFLFSWINLYEWNSSITWLNVYLTFKELIVLVFYVIQKIITDLWVRNPGTVLYLGSQKAAIKVLTGLSSHLEAQLEKNLLSLLCVLGRKRFLVVRAAFFLKNSKKDWELVY